MPSDPVQRAPAPAQQEGLRVPCAAEWAALTEAERAAFEQRVYASLNADISAMSEGTRHFRSKNRAFNDLDDYFDGTGRSVFLACELAVLYPGEEVFSPDLLAVADVADPRRDRDSWRIVDEGRGIDFILEVRNKGKAQKDLRDNLARFARLGIPEYFAYDCRSRALRAWRLPAPGAAEYTPMLPRGGRFPSAVLNLEIAVFDGRLRFFFGNALILSAREQLAQFQQRADEWQQFIEEAERAREEAERAREEEAQLREEAERAQQEERRRREDAERQLLAERVVVHLLVRGVAVTEQELAAIRACPDRARLLDWLEQARTVASPAALRPPPGA